MNTIPLALVVFHEPTGETVIDHRATDVIDRHLYGRTFDVSIRRSIGIDDCCIGPFRDALASGELREITQTVLRSIGDEGEELIRHELAYQFVWITEDDYEFGPVHVLYVLPITQVLLEAGLALDCLIPKATLN